MSHYGREVHILSTWLEVYSMKLPEDEPRKLVLFGADIATSNEAALQMHWGEDRYDKS